MITIIEVVRRKPGLSVEQFQRYWRDTHAAKVRALPGVRRYVQSHTLLSGYAKRVPASRIEIVTEAVVIKDGAIPADGVKNIELVTRKADMAADAFHRYWIDVHGPLGGSIPQVLRYVQSHTCATEYRDDRAPALDGVALTWFTDTGAMRDAARTEQYRRTRADEDNFLTVPLDFVITKEHVVVG